MKPPYVFPAVYLIILLSAAPMAKGVSDPDDEASKAIRSGYRTMDQAYKKNNVEAIEQLFSEGCRIRIRGEGPTIHRKEFINGTRAMLSARTVLLSRSAIKGIKPVKGTPGAYEATVIWTGESRPSAGRTGVKTEKPKAVKQDQRLNDTWQKVDGSWRIIRRLIEG